MMVGDFVVGFLGAIYGVVNLIGFIAGIGDGSESLFRYNRRIHWTGLSVGTWALRTSPAYWLGYFIAMPL